MISQLLLAGTGANTERPEWTIHDPIDRKVGLSWKPGVAAKSLAATPDFLPLGEPRPFGVNIPGADVARTAQ